MTSKDLFEGLAGFKALLVTGSGGGTVMVCSLCEGQSPQFGCGQPAYPEVIGPLQLLGPA